MKGTRCDGKRGLFVIASALGGLLWLAIFAPALLFGQVTTASISGTVTDPSGAVVPKSRVTAIATSTGTSTNAETNAQGFYVISHLQPGAYRLQVSKTGFQSYIRTGITLQVGQAASVNITLKVGSSTQHVTVSGQPALVNTRNQTVSYAITPQFTEDIPLNGRNVLQLVSLAPDTSTHAGTNYANQGATRPDASAGFVTASGEARSNTTTFYLNGGLDEDTYTDVVNVMPNPDAVQEFTVDTNSYNAKYGGMGGGIVDAVTKSGTNHFHGSAFEYVRNGSLNARNFFSAKQDTLKRNQYGLSLGGPIQRDKTFGFFSFQRTTLRYGTTTNVAFGPTPAELNGNWSAITTQLYNDEGNPNSTQPSTTFITNSTVPFPNNQVPTSLYVPLALKILKLVPMGNPATGQIIYNSQKLDNDNQYVGRVDRNFGQKFRLSGSILRDTYISPAIVDPTNALTAGANQSWPSTVGSLQGTYMLGSSLVTTLRASLSRVPIHYNGTHAFPSTLQLGANFPDFNPQGVSETGGYFGWFGWGVDDHYYITRNAYDFRNDWTYSRSNHLLEFGADYTISQSIVNQDFWGNGYTGNYCSYSGYSPLDFLLGQNCYYEQYDPFYDDIRGNEPAMYINDTWRVRPSLTLNLGLRWGPWVAWSDNSAHRDGTVVNQADILAGVHSTRYPNLPPGLLAQGDPGVPSGLAQNDWKLFEPRVGLAWNVFGNGKTSVRAGFGIYHDQPFGRMYNEMLTSFPSISAFEITDPTVPWYDPYASAPYNGVFPSGGYPSASTVFPLPLSFAIGFSPDFKPPATLQWNFTIQQQLGKGVMLSTGYEASESYHMYNATDVNAAIYTPGTNAAGQPLSTSANTAQRRPYYSAGYGGNVIVDGTSSTSSYNALVISAEKRMTGQISFLGGFRWAKCMDESSVASFAFSEFTDPFNRMLDRGRCNSDVGTQFKLAVVERVPTMQRLGFIGRHILGGWKTSGIWNWRDGYPYSIGANGDIALTGTANQRAEIVGNPNLPSGRSTAQMLQEYFNTAAFQNATLGAFGNSARNFLRGPGYADLDFALIKSFPLPKKPLGEATRLDFRAEFFNLFNHPNFGQPDTGLGSPQFGQILSASDPRILQFALKLLF